MTPELIAILTIGAGLFASHWSLHRDMANVRERLAKLEGAMEILTKLLIDRESSQGTAALKT